MEEGFPLPCLPTRTDGSPVQLGICRLRDGFLVRTVSAVWVRGRGAVPVGPGGGSGAMDALRQRLAAARLARAEEWEVRHVSSRDIAQGPLARDQLCLGLHRGGAEP